MVDPKNVDEAYALVEEAWQISDAAREYVKNADREVPLQEIVDKAATGVFKAKPSKIFKFDDIRDAHEAMDSNQSNGKMVVLV